VDALLRLSGVNVSARSSDVKAVVPGIVAMLRLQMPQLPEERQAPSKNAKVEEELDKLTELLAALGDALLATLPLLRPKFGVVSVEDLISVSTEQLLDTLKVDSGRVVLSDKTLTWFILDNGVSKIDEDSLRTVVRKLKLLELPEFVPEGGVSLSALMPVGGLVTTSTVEAVGKELRIGDEVRVVTAVAPALVIRHEREDGTYQITEVTDEMLGKMAAARDKGNPWERPEGSPCVYVRVAVASAFSAKNAACDSKGQVRNLDSARDPAEYAVETRLDADDVARLQRATQTALGRRPGEVSLAQSYGNLFEHRIKAASDMVDLNAALMAAIKAQDVTAAIEAIKQGASCNSKDSNGWTPLQRACASRIDTCDLGMNFIACNQIIEAATHSALAPPRTGARWSTSAVWLMRMVLIIFFETRY
jgi:hypothetical protein